jgi:hypothetical protein
MVRRDCRGFDNFDTVHYPPALMDQGVAVHDVDTWIIDETAAHLQITWDGFPPSSFAVGIANTSELPCMPSVHAGTIEP